MELKKSAALRAELGLRLAADAVAAGELYPDEAACMANHLGGRLCRDARAVIDLEFTEKCASEREEMFAEFLALALDGGRPDVYAELAASFGKGIQLMKKKERSRI